MNEARCEGVVVLCTAAAGAGRARPTGGMCHSCPRGGELDTGIDRIARDEGDCTCTASARLRYLIYPGASYGKDDRSAHTDRSSTVCARIRTRRANGDCEHIAGGSGGLRECHIRASRSDVLSRDRWLWLSYGCACVPRLNIDYGHAVAGGCDHGARQRCVPIRGRRHAEMGHSILFCAPERTRGGGRRRGKISSTSMARGGGDTRLCANTRLTLAHAQRPGGDEGSAAGCAR